MEAAAGGLKCPNLSPGGHNKVRWVTRPIERKKANHSTPGETFYPRC
jgi:hypothetical protein